MSDRVLQIRAEWADDVAYLVRVAEAARELVASVGFRADVESAFGTPTAIVLRDKFYELEDVLRGKPEESA